MKINLKASPDSFLENYKNEKYDSLEEVYFIWYLQELYKRQFILKVLYQEDSYPLSAGLWVRTTEQLKTKVRERKKQLFKPHEYIHDFTIHWNKKAYGTITSLFGEVEHKPIIFWNKISHIEIKGNFDRNNMTRLFKINQKWIWHEYAIFIQLVKLPLFFKITFTPNRYLKQNFRHGERKIHYQPETADNFLKGLSNGR